MPYLLQFKIDFNLYGMGWMRLGKVLFRHPLPEAHHRERLGWAAREIIQTVEVGGISDSVGGAGGARVSQSQRIWSAGSVPSSFKWGQAGAGGRAPVRQSVCELEVDVCVEDILNRREVRGRGWSCVWGWTCSLSSGMQMYIWLKRGGT